MVLLDPVLRDVVGLREGGHGRGHAERAEHAGRQNGFRLHRYLPEWLAGTPRSSIAVQAPAHGRRVCVIARKPSKERPGAPLAARDPRQKSGLNLALDRGLDQVGLAPRRGLPSPSPPARPVR